MKEFFKDKRNWKCLAVAVIPVLAVAVAGMGAIYLLRRFKPKRWHGSWGASLIGLACVTVISRLRSGVHWLTDILGGLLLGGLIVSVYGAACALWGKKKESDI